MKTKDDHNCAYLVAGATLVGKYQIPALKPFSGSLPRTLIPFDQRSKFTGKDYGIHFFLDDVKFKGILGRGELYLGKFKEYGCVVSPDFSVYRDMPLALQIQSIYYSRAFSFFLQRNGIPVLPLARWGDERSFKFCFDGLPYNSLIFVSTYGCIRSEYDQHYFRMGLNELILRKKPSIIVVYGAMPNAVFYPFQKDADFLHYPPYRGGKREAF